MPDFVIAGLYRLSCSIKASSVLFKNSEVLFKNSEGMKCTRPKSHLRLGTWNVRTMNDQGRCAKIVKETKRNNLGFS